MHGSQISMALASTPPLGRRQGPPEAIEAGLVPVLGEVQDPASVQIGHHREVAMTLGDGFLVHPEVGHHLPASAGQVPSRRPRLDPPGFVPGDVQEDSGPLVSASVIYVPTIAE